jgi:hypothetical protein
VNLWQKCTCNPPELSVAVRLLASTDGTRGTPSLKSFAVKSGKADVYRPPGGRTEREVAADVIVRLLEGGVLVRTPSVIARAAAAVGVSIDLIRRSWATQTAVMPDRTLVAGGDDLVPMRRKIEPPDPEPARKPQGGAAHRNATRTAAAYSTPDARRCSKCKAVKSVDEFDWKDRKKGYRRSWCRDCWNAYQRERWLSVEQSNRLKTLLRFVVCEEDHLEADCITCHRPIEAGQEVVADDVKLCHSSCSA